MHFYTFHFLIALNEHHLLHYQPHNQTPSTWFTSKQLLCQFHTLLHRQHRFNLPVLITLPPSSGRNITCKIYFVNMQFFIARVLWSFVLILPIVFSCPFALQIKLFCLNKYVCLKMVLDLLSLQFSLVSYF